MATTITDNGAKITITVGTNSSNILKSSIKDISLIKPDVIMIDTGRGTLKNFFIQFSDVTSPAKPDAGALVDTLLAYLEPTSFATGLATEAKQIDLLGSLNAALLTLGDIKSSLVSMDSKDYYQPLLVESSGTGVVYKGYASPGTAQETAGWAVEKIESIEGVEVHTWANGNRNFENAWTNRATLTYS